MSSDANMATEFEMQLQYCQSKDLSELRSLLEKRQSRIQSGKPADRITTRLKQRITHSVERTRLRQALVPDITYPEELPIAAKRDELKKLISNNQVVILAGETGSGKTTQIPKICLELGRGVRGLIGHTQPRRIAARTVASRIAEELQDQLGNRVGYQVRFNEQCSENTLVKLMTDGILLAEIQQDGLLSQYDTLIIDEAHERSLNIDFLLGYVKQLMPQRPDLKVIITSATIDLEKFSKHFDQAPILEVSGRTYPVETIYREPDPEQGLPEQIVEVVEEILTLPKRGDILVFLSGERDIREVAKALRHRQLPHLEVLPLYARLSLAEQTRVFRPHKGTRIVLSTNVAETSLTVPGIRYVIDPGYARISRYSYRTKVQRLPVEAVSKASAEQRKGRCGRISEGVCYRLYSEQDYASRPDFTDPEILRTNLGSVILQMLHLRIGNIQQFPFVDSPDNKLINHGFSLLYEIGAVDDKQNLLPTGRQLARLPVDPRISIMLIASARMGALREMLVIASALSLQDPRERPADKQQQADEKHRQWQDKDSDFVALLNLWNHFEEQRQALSRNQFEKYCRQQFVSPLRMREWRELHHQLHGLCREMKLAMNKSAAGYDSVHRSILSGLLTQVGSLDENREYLGTHNRRFVLFPSSGLARKPPKWVMTAELIETSRLFAHCNARIEPEWLSELAPHLIRRSYSEPHYSARQGQVMAYEKLTLGGLTVVARQRCSYGKIDPVLAREIFLRAAFVEGQYRGKGAFFRKNQALKNELEELESKLRRKDILVDDEVVFEFYRQRIPADIVNLAGFEKWRQAEEKRRPSLLLMDRSTLVASLPSSEEQAQFPDHIHWQGVTYPLSYHFEPGSERDGVTVTLPVSILHQVPAGLFEWLVPGLVREKSIALLKGLPKQLRKHFVPVPEYVDRAMRGIEAVDEPLTDVLGFQLKRLTGVHIPETAWTAVSLDDYYRMNFRLVDDQGRVLAEKRDLSLLKAEYKQAFQTAVATSKQGSIERDDIARWDFGELPEVYAVKKGQHTIRTYPALVVEGENIALRLQDKKSLADNLTMSGLTLLARKQFPDAEKYLRKQLLKKSNLELQLKGARLAGRNLWIDRISEAAYASIFRIDSIPRHAGEFEDYFASEKKHITPLAMAMEKGLTGWLDQIVEIRRQLRELPEIASFAVADIEQQIAGLVQPDVFRRYPMDWIRHYNRYFEAISIRLEKLVRQVDRDLQFTKEITEFDGHLSELPDWLEMSPELQQAVNLYRFMIEEYRVSLFAQQLKTAIPVSAKRLHKQWDKVKALLG